MEYRIVRSDELYHYGVPGMRWGHRKGPTSLAGTGHRAMAGVYGMNQRFYNKTGNKALASMNAQAKNQALKKAAAADAAKAHKKAAATGAKIAKQQAAKNAKTSYKEAKASRKIKNAATKDYKKAYDAKETELYRKNSKALEKAKGDNYYKLVDSIQDQASSHAMNQVKNKYGITSPDDLNRKKIRYTESSK